MSNDVKLDIIDIICSSNNDSIINKILEWLNSNKMSEFRLPPDLVNQFIHHINVIKSSNHNDDIAVVTYINQHEFSRFVLKYIRNNMNIRIMNYQIMIEGMMEGGIEQQIDQTKCINKDNKDNKGDDGFNVSVNSANNDNYVPIGRTIGKTGGGLVTAPPGFSNLKVCNDATSGDGTTTVNVMKGRKKKEKRRIRPQLKVTTGDNSTRKLQVSIG